MTRRRHLHSQTGGKKNVVRIFLAVFCLLTTAAAVDASSIHVATIKTEIESLYLTGVPVNMPLGQGYNPVQSLIVIQESLSKASQGMSLISRVPGSTTDFYVTSFFDIFLDMSLTDVDSVNDFFGRPDGSSIQFSTKAKLKSEYTTSLNANQSLFSLFPPPEQASLSGKLCPSKIDLGEDLNADGKKDFIKFDTFSISMIGSPIFEILPDGSVVLNFNLGGSLTGNVNPPFTIGPLYGPTTASAELIGGPAVPLPGSFGLLFSGLFGLIFWRKRNN